MGRGNTNLSLIQDDEARISTMKKRREGLTKKASELSTLCGTPTVCLFYDPSEPEPTVWPAHDVVQQQLNRFFSVSEVERSKKATTQESYLEVRISKVREQLTKQVQRKNHLEEAVLMDEVFYGKGMDGLNSHELDSLAFLMKEKINELKKKREFYEGDCSNQQRPPPPNVQQLAFGNAFSSSSSGQDAGKGSMDVVMTGGNALFHGENNFNLPPVPMSPTVHYHQQGSGENVEAEVVRGDQFPEESGRSSNWSSEQPRGRGDQEDDGTEDGVAWASHATDFPPAE